MKYKLQENGVFDTEENLSIPNSSFNRHWIEYQEWLGAGNTPDPFESPLEILELVKEMLHTTVIQLGTI